MSPTNREAMLEKIADLDAQHAVAVAGGGEKYVERHHARGKLMPRERIELLIDEGSAFLELSPLAGWGSDFAVGASVVTGIGVIEGVECLITANDPSVKGGASNPWTVKKIFRASQIAEACLAKQTACDAATYVCDQAVQLHGGTGYMHGTEVERHYRDARILPIGGGATEVLTDLAAKLLGYAS